MQRYGRKTGGAFNLMIQPTPITDSTAQYHYAWARRARSALMRDGQACRLSPEGLAIEARSLHTNQWMPIQLQHMDTQFANTEDRLLIFEMVTGLREIPEPVVATIEEGL